MLIIFDNVDRLPDEVKVIFQLRLQ